MGQVGRINTDQQEPAYDISCRMVLKQQKNQSDLSRQQDLPDFNLEIWLIRCFIISLS